jgi:hypothetical protein
MYNARLSLLPKVMLMRLLRGFGMLLVLLLAMLVMPNHPAGATTIHRPTEHAVMPHPMVTERGTVINVMLHRTDFAGTDVGYLNLMRRNAIGASIVKRTRPTGALTSMITRYQHRDQTRA